MMDITPPPTTNVNNFNIPEIVPNTIFVMA